MRSHDPYQMGSCNFLRKIEAVSGSNVINSRSGASNNAIPACNWEKRSACTIDDYAKDGRPEEVWLLCSFYHESLRTWIKTIVNKFAISNHTALILGMYALRSYLRTTVPLVSYIRNSLRFWYYASLSTCWQNLEKKLGSPGKFGRKRGSNF